MQFVSIRKVGITDIEADAIVNAANEILFQLKQRYEAVYAVHEDTHIPHIHFAFNPVSHVDGTKYHGSKQEFHDLMEMLRDAMKYIGVYKFFRVKYVPDGEDRNECY